MGVALILVAACGSSSKPAARAPSEPVAGDPAAVEASAPVEASAAVEASAPAPDEPAPTAPAHRAAVAAPTTTAPTMADAEFDAVMDQLVAMLHEIAAAFERANGDCGKGAAGLEKVLADNQAFLDKMRTYRDNPEMTRKAEEWMQGHLNEVMQPAMRMAELGQKCANDPQFAAAMKKMEELGD